MPPSKLRNVLCGIFVVIYTISASESAHPWEECSEPPDLQQRLMQLQSSHQDGHLHESFNTLPFFRNAFVNESAEFLRGGGCEPKILSGRKECPKHKHDSHQGDPCPTYTVINCDNNRYPRLLMETKCSCRRCHMFTKMPRDQMTPTCEGVFYHVRVLKRKGCRDGIYQYISTVDSLQIGCACSIVPKNKG